MPLARRQPEPPPQVHGRLSKFDSKQKRVEPIALLAAAEQVTVGGENGKAPTTVVPTQQWQTRALGYYDILGECWNPAQFVATALSKMRFYVAEIGEDGQPREVENVPDDVAAIVKVLQDCSYNYGRLAWLVGETRLCQWRDHDDLPTDPLKWDCFSPIEIKITDQNRTIVRKPWGTGKDVEYTNISEQEGEPQPGEMRTWRFWKPHPGNSQLADSPVRANLDIYEQLWWLLMGERADLQNRIASNGFLLAPVELDWKPPASAEAEGTEEDTEDGTLVEYIGEVMMTAIGDPSSAAGAVPGVIEGKAEFLQYIRMLFTHEGSQSLVFVSQREEALIRRLAQNLPLPVEAITGMSQANHWSAWKIEDEKWQLTEPWVTGYARDATLMFFQPYLQANKLNEDWFIWYDFSGLVSDPDKGATAIKLNEAGLLDGDETLKANGWSETSRMQGEELDWWRAIKLRDPAVAGVEGTAPTESGGGSDEQPPVEDNAPDRDDDAAAAALKKRALDFADARARGAVGAAVRGHKRTCPECLQGLEEVPNEKLLDHLDSDTVDRLGHRQTKLVEQATATFATAAHELGYNVAPHLAAVVQWYSLTLYASEALPEDLVDRIGYAGVAR